MSAASTDPFDFLSEKPPGFGYNSRSELVQQLLYEIVRVKELISFYNEIPNGAGQLGASILNELVTEAYNSLVNYDVELMRKYYDLLLHCD